LPAINAINLALRFLLELAALAAVGYWGWTSFPDVGSRLLAGIGLPLLLAALWGIFRVPGDGGPPVIAIPGWLRLILEGLVFGLAVALLADAGHGRLALLFLAVVLVNYTIDYRRVLSILRR
jgi:hypothetical protein